MGPLDDDQKKKLYDSILTKYQNASDRSALERAEKEADRNRMISHLAEAFEGLARAEAQARGGKGVDSGFYQGLRGTLDGRVEAARQARKDKMNTVLTQDELGWKDKERGQQLKDWDAKNVERDRAESIRKREDDPGSEESKLAQDIASKMMPGRDFSKMSATQLRASIPSLEKIYSLEERRRLAEAQKMEAAEKPRNISQMNKEGLAKVGLLAERQYRDAIEKGKKSGEYDPTKYSDFLDNSRWAPRWLRNDHANEARAAQDSWIDSFLRDESGAAIPESEREAYREIYFPQMGDSDEVVKNKQKLREQKMRNAMASSGIEVPENLFDEKASEAPSDEVREEDVKAFAESHGIPEPQARIILRNRMRGR